MKNYEIIFDDVILSQLKEAGKNMHIKNFLSKMLDKIEELGPNAGKLLDSHLFLYEVKNKHPPIRLYFKHMKDSTKIYVFEYELKTSEDKQKKTIFRLRERIRTLFI